MGLIGFAPRHGQYWHRLSKSPWVMGMMVDEKHEMMCKVNGISGTGANDGSVLRAPWVLFSANDESEAEGFPDSCTYAPGADLRPRRRFMQE